MFKNKHTIKNYEQIQTEPLFCSLIFIVFYIENIIHGIKAKREESNPTVTSNLSLLALGGRASGGVRCQTVVMATGSKSGQSFS